jgi:O-antigen/teichoic acid export membrane protein
MTSFICLCSGYILLSVELYGKAFIETWLGPAYTISSSLLFYFILTGCVEYCMYPAKEMLYGIAKHKGLAILHTVELFLLIVLSYFLTQQYGLIGFGYASVLAVIPLEIICIPILLNHYLDVHVSKILLPVGKIMMVWGLILYTMYIIISPNVENSFVSIIVWNMVQLVISAPCVILLLPDQIRNIVLNKMDKLCKF